MTKAKSMCVTLIIQFQYVSKATLRCCLNDSPIEAIGTNALLRVWWQYTSLWTTYTSVVLVVQ